MVREPEGAPDPQEKVIDNLCEHLEIPQNRDFNAALSLAKRQEVGRRLKDLLEVLSDGALVPLMHVTLDDTNVKKLAEWKNILPSLLAEKLGLNDGRPFQVLKEEEQKNAGNMLSNLVREAAKDAIVPLINETLSKDEVLKLCCLKGIKGSELETATSNKGEETHEESDVDENMKLAIQDMQAQNFEKDGEDEQLTENPPITTSSQDVASTSNQSSNEEHERSSSRIEGAGGTIRSVPRDPVLKTDLMRLSMDLQKQIMDFIYEKCY